MLNEYITKQLSGYYPKSNKITTTLVHELSRGFGIRGCGQAEFDEALDSYRLSDKAPYCPTWLDLRNYLPLRAKGNWTGIWVFGIFIPSQDDWSRFCELAFLGCTSPRIMGKYNLKEPGANYIMAGSILLQYAVGEVQQKLAERYMGWAAEEHKRMGEFTKAHDAKYGESVWKKALRRICEKAGG